MPCSTVQKELTVEKSWLEQLTQQGPYVSIKVLVICTKAFKKQTAIVLSGQHTI